ncbi:MAG: aminotransferase class V-fold PLP-dependent enzyme [Rhodothermales bacterium]
MESLEQYFHPFRRQIIGQDQIFDTPYGPQRILYADWTASGRLYAPIENALRERFGPYVGNTHTETSVTGTSMTCAYHHAREIIKRHVNAGPDDVLITAGSGMTRVINKLQRILGLRIPEQAQQHLHLPEKDRPVIFVTHMEHHSNHTSWLETIADVEWLPPDEKGLVDPAHLEKALEKYHDRTLKIGAFTACSNVTGICTPYYALARLMHRHGGVCFVDFAASGPYVDIDMHPPDPEARLDAVYFSPHKFLGGPGTAAVLVFNSALYHNRVPDLPGGGTVNWTNPWGEHSYIQDIELREDGGTPAFLQTIKTALAIRLKEEMGTAKLLAREHELLAQALPALRRIPGLHILADHVEDRLGIVSFYVEGIHYNMLVRLLNDRFGIQVRGGCSCAGTYGHYLLHVSFDQSHYITDRIEHGDLSAKPGWVRLSLHPTMTDDELRFVIEALQETVAHIDEWREDYLYNKTTNEYAHRRADGTTEAMVQGWFDLAAPVLHV